MHANAFRRAREYGPVLLIPLAWGFVAAAHLGAVSESTLFVAHVVMAPLLAGFAVTGRRDMRDGALATWWALVAVGFVVTVVGAVGLRLGPAGAPLRAVALFGWMLLPAVGFLDTGRRVTERPWVYYGGAVGCAVGAAWYAVALLGGPSWGSVGGLALVGAGQTVTIVDAAFAAEAPDPA